MPRAALLMLLALALAPAQAHAHAEIRSAGGTLAYFSEDASSASRLELTASLATIAIYDPGSVGGMTAPASCRPGRTDDRGFIVEYTCPATGVSSISLDVGPNEDAAQIDSVFGVRLLGGEGADRSTGGAAADIAHGGTGNDMLATGAGNDVLEPGPGSDTTDAGPGDDETRAADGERDTIRCGDGADRVAADQLDEIQADCETVERSQVAPPAATSEGDSTAPRLTLRTATRRRLGSGRVPLTLTATESGTVTASAFLAAGGINSRLRAVTAAATAGRARRLTLRLTATQIRRIRRARKGALTISAIATDRAGNASPTRAARIRLTP